MRRILFLMVFLIGASSFFYVDEGQAQNCPNDWHPPPCGTPPKPVKSWLQQQLEKAEQYHFSASQLFGVAMAASCKGSTGEPRIDQVRSTVCAVASSLIIITAGMQVWENRLIEQLNALRDGGTQFVAQVPMESIEVVIDSDNPHIASILYHRDVIESLGAAISDSVQGTLACDAWAQTDVRGIYCGNDQRAWTETLFDWMGQHYAAAAGNTAGLAVQMSWDEYADWGFISNVEADATMNNDLGWGYMQ